jgi:hypothetical protein
MIVLICLDSVDQTNCGRRGKDKAVGQERVVSEPVPIDGCRWSAACAVRLETRKTYSERNRL